MREWVPVPGSTRGDLVLAAVREFAAHGYGGVGVGDLATAAGVTTGALYHHFGSKQGLYLVVREDVERRLVDRMDGAAVARQADGPATALHTALLVGFDWATSQGMARLLSEPHPGRPAAAATTTAAAATADPVVAFVTERLGHERASGLATVLLAGWRAALRLTVDGLSAPSARRAWESLRFEAS